MPNVTVYSQPGCMPCTMTMRQLDKLGVAYTSIDITTDPDAASRLQAGGWRTTPVVSVSRRGDVVAVWSGFRWGAIKALGAQVEDLGAFDMRGA